MCGAVALGVHVLSLKLNVDRVLGTAVYTRFSFTDRTAVNWHPECYIYCRLQCDVTMPPEFARGKACESSVVKLFPSKIENVSFL